MGIKERRAKEKEILRQEILDAARELFVKEGYENVSMRKVAEKIEYSPTTIYLYFKDKAELLHSLCEEAFARLLETFERIGEEKGDPVLRLKKSGLAYVEFGLKYPNHYKLLFLVHPDGTEDSERYSLEESLGWKAFNFLKNIVTECVKQEKFRSVDVEMTTQALWAAVHGIASLLIVHPDFPWVDKDQLVNYMLDTLCEGLQA